MLTIIDKSVKVNAVTDVDAQLAACPDNVYAAWIARVKANGTPVHDGDTYVWLYVQLLPPRLVNCIITVKPGDGTPLDPGIDTP